ncbi:dihydroxy-acid dehydratase [Sporichthya brevicatena]|uniref:Dihydroxy-acid dehydratase n=1 Tax=Sporichthya brevicatena TaxID=171442 RepID=A0ABN1GJ67_9ACTN
MNVPRVGDTSELVVCEELTRTRIVQFAAASGELSPVHIDEEAAQALGHPTVMGHGMMTLAMAARVITCWFGADALRTLSARFTAPVWPGDCLSSRAVVTSVETVGALTLVGLALEATNGRGIRVLAGQAGVAIDRSQGA